MTTPTTTPAQPEALAHAAGLESFAKQLPAYGFNPQPLKDAASTIRALHAQVAALTAAPGVQAEPNSFVVSAVVLKEIDKGFNTQNKLYPIEARSAEEAAGKVLPMIAQDFPEHRLHTMCQIAVSHTPTTQPAPSAAAPCDFCQEAGIQACTADSDDEGERECAANNPTARPAPQPSPTPQADSQPAPASTRQIAECYGDCPTDPKTCPNPCHFEGRSEPARAGTIAHEGQYLEEVAYGPPRMMERLGKWLRKYFDSVAAPTAEPAPAAQPAPLGVSRCDDCEGTGGHWSRESAWCPKCDGTGAARAQPAAAQVVATIKVSTPKPGSREMDLDAPNWQDLPDGEHRLYLTAPAVAAPTVPEGPMFTTPDPDLNELLEAAHYLHQPRASMDDGLLFLDALGKVMGRLAAAPQPPAGGPVGAQEVHATCDQVRAELAVLHERFPETRPAPADAEAPAAGAVAHTLSNAQIEAMPVWRNFVGLWPESRREIVDAVVDLLAAAPTPAAQGDAEDAALWRTLMNLPGARRRIWNHVLNDDAKGNANSIEEALRAALAQKEGGK